MKPIKTIFAFTAFTLLLATAAIAAKTADSLKSLPVELKYMGQVESQYMFSLRVNDLAQKMEYIIEINDDKGYELFKGTVKGRSITKRFALNAELFSESVVTFTITEKITGNKISFQANQQVKTSLQMNIVKM